ncbi:MAG: carbohydrate kinase [Chloroflexi bacterium]|nr:carbohydrate kinase [Chloroflexota bacterium]
MGGRIVVGGESLVDRIRTVDGSVRDVPGGGPYNTARALGRLGLGTAFLGCISTDALGGTLLTGLIDDGVITDLVTRTDAPTTLALADLDASGTARYTFLVDGTAAPRVTREDALRALDGEVAAIHVGTLGLVFQPVSDSLEALVAAAPPDTLVMLDPNARPSATPDLAAWRARVGRLARRADIIRASTDDLTTLDDRRDPVAVARGLAMDGALVLLTDGGRPIRLVSRAFPPTELPLLGGPVVDTVGAGDSFGAAFLGWLLDHGLDRGALEDPGPVHGAARVALAAAAITCSRRGADPPTRAELDAAWHA